jgi:hypothetical protein
MSVRVEGQIVHLDGDIRIEDAESLLQALLSDSRPTVDLSACRSLHAAAAQLLLAFRPPMAGMPENRFLSQTLMPALARASPVSG